MCLRIMRSRKQWRSLLSAGFVVASVFSIVSGAQIVYADTPAVTDFGQETVQPTLSPGKPQNAVFFTLYADGHGQVQVRTVHGDAVVSFAGEHPVWRLDHGLMWFVEMPVYVRELSVAQTDSGNRVI